MGCGFHTSSILQSLTSKGKSLSLSELFTQLSNQRVKVHLIGPGENPVGLWLEARGAPFSYC